MAGIGSMLREFWGRRRAEPAARPSSTAGRVSRAAASGGGGLHSLTAFIRRADGAAP